MTMPKPGQLESYASRLLLAAREMVANPNDMAARDAYVRAAFNLDWTAAAIILLTDKIPPDPAP